jgi:hypothetical protein
MFLLIWNVHCNPSVLTWFDCFLAHCRHRGTRGHGNLGADLGSRNLPVGVQDGLSSDFEASREYVFSLS